MGTLGYGASWLQIKITSADLPGTFRCLNDKQIILYDIRYINDLSAYVTIKRKDVNASKELLRKRGDNYTVTHLYNIYGLLYRLRRRYIIVLGIIALLALTVYIPSRIFFVQVKGNHNLSAQYIAEKVMDKHITFGCKRWDIRSEQIKNSLLEQIPELDWIGVTTTGCVATVEVKEKEIPDMIPQRNFCNIVSIADGIVESVTVTRGNALCAPGQAVRNGQYLISGYVDQGFLIKATGAEGEILARTIRKIEAVTPASYTVRGDVCETNVKYALQIGKKVINFSKDSSISPISCDKIYTKRYITLPGGYILPIAFILEETVQYKTYDEANEDFLWVESAAENYLHSQMLAGEILEKATHQYPNDALFVLSGYYICREQIGKYKFEEKPLNYGENS